MLTDIFAYRYIDVPLFSELTEPLRRLLVQGFRILNEQVQPYWINGKESEPGKIFWAALNKQLAMELGLENLSNTHFPYTTQWQGNKNTQMHRYTCDRICSNCMSQPISGTCSVDQHLKERLSLIELGFRKKEREIEVQRILLPATSATPLSGIQQVRGIGLRGAYDTASKKFEENVVELNTRFRQAGVKLNYHNGFIQIAQDELTQEQIETPFWALVASNKWSNVDADMKNAVDLRDGGGRDPALYAARALESTIKIISGEKGWTHGKENGASNYIENLSSKKNGFIEPWEADLLKLFFSKVRNPMGHGPGDAPMPTLTAQQTQAAIEFCMSQCKNLISRL